MIATPYNYMASFSHMYTRLFPAIALLSIFGAIPAFGQFIQFGIKAGVPLNDAYIDAYGESFTSASTERYIIGPQVEVRLPFHLGLEVDALYRHYNLNGNGADEWDFPILVKYRFKGVPFLHPFVDGGPIFNHVSELPNATTNQSTAGFALGAGMDFRALILHVTPEFRYVRWGDQNYRFQYATSLASNQNQAEFLVGFTF